MCELMFATKDIATLCVSGAALITSVSVAFYNARVQRVKRLDDARRSFEDAILGISKAKQDFETLRISVGDEFDAPKYSPHRTTIVDTRNFYLSKALAAFRAGSFVTSSADNMLIASALIESGRVAASIPFYDRSVEFAADRFELAMAKRVLGRARILSNDFERGRSEMLGAAKMFGALIDDPGFDGFRMRREEAETYRRLIAAQRERNSLDFLLTDVDALTALLPALDKPRALQLRSFIADARSALGRKSKDFGGGGGSFADYAPA
ncbi:hypothetical protein GCM10009087_40610 [Sphingomonas oligophenolica]|uniref:Uncharacterized protein n=1 Tax=Sphingomonas oligophenolica TaxID=301154 RepID=A0ABU9Y205_9SPHN